jgi:transcriptional regulator with GAF, ATPase, and Fis domain
MSSSSVAILKRAEVQPAYDSYVELNRYVEQQSSVPGEWIEFDGILGSSRALCKVLDQVRIVAPTDSTVLIEGETGTGKEVIASAIHMDSNRGAAHLLR